MQGLFPVSRSGTLSARRSPGELGSAAHLRAHGHLLWSIPTWLDTFSRLVLAAAAHLRRTGLRYLTLPTLIFRVLDTPLETAVTLTEMSLPRRVEVSLNEGLAAFLIGFVPANHRIL